MSAVDSAVKSRGPETTAPPVSSKDFHGHSDRPRGFFPGMLPREEQCIPISSTQRNPNARQLQHDQSQSSTYISPCLQMEKGHRYIMSQFNLFEPRIPELKQTRTII
jgi:hypothetical protein